MEVSNYTTTVIKASAGHTLTESADIENSSRTLAKTIYLASTASIDDWKEITDEEADIIRQIKEQVFKNYIDV